MLQKLKYYLLSLFILFVCTTSTTYALELKNDRDTVLNIGMEMSNIREMFKAYILTAADVSYKNPTKQLKNAMQKHEELLNAVESKYKNPEIQESLQRSRAAWAKVKESMNLAFTNEKKEKLKKAALFIHANLKSVIKELSFMKKHILSQSTIQNKETFNASLDMGIAIRALSVHYMMDYWKLNDPTINKHWAKGLKKYKKSLALLKASSYSDNEKFKSLYYALKKHKKYLNRMWGKPKDYYILIDKKSTIAYNQAEEMTRIILNNTN